MVATGSYGKTACKKGKTEVSCEGVEDAKREFICWNAAKKGEISEEMKTKKCQWNKKGKKKKKNK